MKRILVFASLVALGLPLRAQNTFAPDAEGFIRNWLVLAAIPLNNESGADQINFDFLKGEAAIRPKPDAQVTIGGKTLTWKTHRTPGVLHRLQGSFRSGGR